jgi:hypothetical protein
MARIVLKDPRQPSLKKSHTPLSVKYKRYLRISIIINILLTGVLFYTKNKLIVDKIYTTLILKIKHLL